jgi:integrase/recombinase XerC
MKFKEAIQFFNKFRQLKVEHNNGADSDLKNFAMFMHNCDIENVRAEDVLEYLNYYPEFEFERATLIKKETHLRKFFEFYKRQGYDIVDPYMIPVSRPKFTMPRVCDEKSYRKLIAAIPKDTTAYYHIRNLCLINIIWETGARLGEICALNVSDLDLKNKEVTIKTEKSRGIYPFRKIPWSKDTDYSLPRWLKRRAHIVLEYDLPEPDALFIGLKATGGKRLAVCAAGEIFRKYSNKAGLQIINAHSLRHHFGHQLAKEKISNSVISAALGHSSLQSSYRYSLLNSDELSRVLKKRK